MRSSVPAQNDFNYAILNETAHRPWPMPASPWVMTQTWHNLLFAHWRVSPDALRPLIPAPLALETFEAAAWIGVVPFYMTNVAPRAVPALPWLSAFPELNVRTYVRLNGRSGVYFFSLDASNRLAVRAARMLFRLPYFTADITVRDERGGIRYESRRVDSRGRPASFAAVCRPISPSHPPVPGSLESFLTERYCLFTVDGVGRSYSVDIHHPPWPLQVAEATITTNTMTSAIGLEPSGSPLLHFARRQDVVAWPLRRE